MIKNAFILTLSLVFVLAISYVITTGNKHTLESIFDSAMLVILALSFISGVLLQYFRTYNSKKIDESCQSDETGELLSAERYNNILSHAVDGVITINSKGIITLFSGSSETIFGYNSSEVIGKNISMLMPPEHQRDHDTYLSNYHATSNPGIIGNGPRELKGQRSDGSIIDIEVSINKITSNEDTEYIGIVRDICERKQAEDLLLISRNRFRSAIEQFPFSIQIFDTDGTLTNVNSASKKLWGKDNCCIGDYNILKDNRLIQNGTISLIKKAFEGTPLTIPVTLFDLIDSVGTNRWIQSQIFPVFDNDGEIYEIVFISEDTTEKMRSEEDRIKLNRHIRMLLESVNEGIIGVNLSGICTFINDSAVTKLGYSTAEEILGEKILSVIYKNNLDSGKHIPGSSPIEKAYMEGESAHHKNEVFSKNNHSTFPAEYSARPIFDDRLITGAVISFNDISDRKKSETIIKENENKYHQLFGAVSDAIIVFDSESFQIIEMNSAAVKLYGFSPDHSSTVRFSELFVDSEKAKNFISNSEIPITIDSEITHKNLSGHEFPVEISFGRFQFHANVLICAAIRDITERKENELKLKHARDSAIKAFKTKSQFLANISHEIRTPMNGILGTLELLSESSLNNEQSDYVTTSMECSKNLMELLDDILCFTKSESERLSIEVIPFKMSNIIIEIISSHQKSADNKQIKLNYNINDEIPAVLRGDPTRLRQIINNLVGNAIKFTSKGEVSLLVSVLKINGDDITLHFSISDTGIGISEENHRLIFDTFSQADESTTRTYGGTGLGLAICKQLVNRMGGEIGVKSSLDKGSTFWFDLTFSLTHEKIEDNAVIVDDAKISLGYSVLVAEDNLVNQKVTKSILQKLGCHVTIANNGEEAVSYSISEKFDIILMDCQMPKMDGYEATGKIRTVDNPNVNTPVIAVTANVMPGDENKCIASGMNDYIPKPVNKGSILIKLNTWADVKNSASSDPQQCSTLPSSSIQVKDNDYIK